MRTSPGHPALGTAATRVERLVGTTTRRWFTAVLVTLALLGWLVARSIQVYRHLGAARAVLTVTSITLDVNGEERLLRQTRIASSELRKARDASDDPVFWLAAHVPLLGRSFSLAREATLVSQQVVDKVLSPVVLTVTSQRGPHLVQHGRVDLKQLARLEGPLERAALAAAQARRRAEALPTSLVPDVLLSRRQVLVEQVDRLDRAIATANTVVSLAPEMLGSRGLRRYFLAVQNTAETRGTGGLIGAYAVVVADHGLITRERVGTDIDLHAAATPVVDLGRQYADHYDQYRSRQVWSSAVMTPEWPSAAATIAGLWTRQSHQAVDGVIGMDPRAMAAVLAVTGPVETAGRRITSENVVDFILRDEYMQFAEQPARRKPLLGQLAVGIFDKAVSGGGSSFSLIKALGSAVHGGHVLLWSHHETEQVVLQRTVISGRLPDARASLEVTSVNAAGSKLDFYVRRTIGYVRTGTNRATVSVTLVNAVQAQTVPDFVKSRIDRYGSKHPIAGLDGSTSQILTVFGGLGQGLFKATVNGSPAAFEYGVESGHPYATTTVELKPGVPVRVDVALSDFGGTLVYRQQPLVVDDTLRMSVPFRIQG